MYNGAQVKTHKGKCKAASSKRRLPKTKKIQYYLPKEIPKLAKNDTGL
ncbi:hypothetical protein CsSME_00036227 [Camellia sinensis var. sinensis]